jgi:hypothetical protein
MMSFLRKLDAVLFSPPHTFQTILALLILQLSLASDLPFEQTDDEKAEQAGIVPGHESSHPQT